MKNIKIAVAAAFLLLAGANSPLFAQSSGCWTTLDFSRDISGNTLAAGAELTDQYADWGIKIQGVNQKKGHPNKAIVFNSAQPSGGDADLGTPHESHGGPGKGEAGGASNTKALGNLLIVAENDRDGDGDGLIDEPDDEAAGGALIFRFDKGAKIRNIVFVDIDANETGAMLRLTNPFGEAQEVAVTGLGDNSVVELNQEWENIQYLEIILPGSGAVASLDFCLE